MAKKINLQMMVQENRGQADVAHRPGTKVSPALYLMQLRLPKLRISPLKKKLVINVDYETLDQIEHPVKIRHSD